MTRPPVGPRAARPALLLAGLLLAAAALPLVVGAVAGEGAAQPAAAAVLALPTGDPTGPVEPPRTPDPTRPVDPTSTSAPAAPSTPAASRSATTRATSSAGTQAPARATTASRPAGTVGGVTPAPGGPAAAGAVPPAPPVTTQPLTPAPSPQPGDAGLSLTASSTDSTPTDPLAGGHDNGGRRGPLLLALVAVGALAYVGVVLREPLADALRRR